MVLKPGDVVIYTNSRASGSIGSLAVVSSVETPTRVTVKWISANGVVVNMSPDAYHPECFAHVGHIEVQP